MNEEQRGLWVPQENGYVGSRQFWDDEVSSWRYRAQQAEAKLRRAQRVEMYGWAAASVVGVVAAAAIVVVLVRACQG